MKKFNLKTLISMTVIILIIGLSHGKIMSFASEKDDYIIVTKDNSTYKSVVNDYEKNMINDESGLLKEQETAVVHISEWEANKLEKDEDIVCVEPIVDVAATGIQSNSVNNYVDEWNLKMINADNVSGNNNVAPVKVAILDSGIDYSDKVNVVKRKNFIEEYDSMEMLFEDTTGHGTSIASILAAQYNGETSVKGVNNNVEIYSAKILDENNIAPMDRVIESIYWAIDEEVDIISISFGTDYYSEALEIAIKEAYNKGILIVAAAGNENIDKIQYPAAFDEVIGVGGVDSKGNISSYSSMSNKIDVYAPGEQIKAIGSFNGEVVVSGTSIAVPHVVGVASILMQEDNAKSNEFIKQLIIESSNKSENLNNAGIVDLEYALQVYDNFDVTNSNESLKVDNTTQLYIDNDVNYVTGSWGMKAHQQTVTNSDNISSLNSSEVAILKWGAVYPDKTKNLKGMTGNPYFHGYSKKSNIEKNYNYLASYIYLTRCALSGQYNQSKDGLVNTSGNIGEIDQKLQLINFGGTELIGGTSVSILQGNSNTQKNRSLFYLGMAMHTAADIYAHSSYSYSNGKWIYISHSSTEITESDNVNYRPKRYEAAKKVVSTILSNYLNGKEGSVEDFVLSNQYYDGSFKIRKMYDYANEIGTLDSNSAKVLQDITYGYKPQTQEKEENETKVDGLDTQEEQNDAQINVNTQEVQNDAQINVNTQEVQNDVQTNVNTQEVQNDVQINVNTQEVQNDVQINVNTQEVQNDAQTNVNTQEVQNDVQTNVNTQEIQNDVQTNVNTQEVQNDVQTNVNTQEVQNDAQTNVNTQEVQNNAQTNVNTQEVQNDAQTNVNTQEVQNNAQTNVSTPEVQSADENLKTNNITDNTCNNQGNKNNSTETVSNDQNSDDLDAEIIMEQDDMSSTNYVNESVNSNLQGKKDDSPQTNDTFSSVKVLVLLLAAMMMITFGYVLYARRGNR